MRTFALTSHWCLVGSAFGPSRSPYKGTPNGDAQDLKREMPVNGISLVPVVWACT